MRIVRLVLEGLRGRKRDTAVLGGVLLLSFLFLTLSSILLASFSESAQQQRQALHGNWQMMYYAAGENAREQFSPMAECGEIRLVGSTKEQKWVGSMDEAAFSLGSFRLEEGRLPQTEDEIVLVRGRTKQEPMLGETVEMVYLYDYMRGGGNQWRTDLRELVLASLRESDAEDTERAFEWKDAFYADVQAFYDEENNALSFNDGGTMVFPPEYDLDRMLAEREDDLLYVWAMSFMGSDYYTMPLAISRVTAYPGGLYSYGGFLINVKNMSTQITLNGWGYSEKYRGKCIEQSQTGQTVLYKTYTVVGYIAPYADHWDARGYSMPDAFVSPAAADAQLAALRRAEQDYYEGAPRFAPTSILLMRDEAQLAEELGARVLPVFSRLQEPYFRMEGFHAGYEEVQEGFLIGRDPASGKEKTLQLFCSGADYYLQDELGDWRRLSGDPRVPSRWEEFDDILQPMQPSMLTLSDLEGGGYALRINQYSYPPANGAESSVQLLCSGILIGVAAVSSFQVFWVQLRRRRMRLTTLMSIGASDGQVLRMLCLEVFLLLTASCVLGFGLGYALAWWITDRVISVFTVRWYYLIRGVACCFAAVMISAFIPMLLVLRAPLTGREQIGRSILRLRPPKKLRRQSYMRLLLRQMRANRGRTALQFLLACLLALSGLLTVFLCHNAFKTYRRTVTDAGMPDYELVAPYGMSKRYHNTLLETAAPLREGASLVSVWEAPNVWLNVDAYLETSPILRALQQTPQAAGMFRALGEEETGFSVRVIGLEEDSPLWERLFAAVPEGAADRASLLSGESCILLVPHYVPEGSGVRARQADEESLRLLREDEKAGYLLDLSYERIFAAAGQEDRAIRAGDSVKLTAFSQNISGEMLWEKCVERKLAVEAVISVLDEPLWPLFRDRASHVVISGDALVQTHYPSANTRMTGDQARGHRLMAKIFYPDCYGLTRFVVMNDQQADPIAQDTAASDLAEEYGLDFLNYRMQKEREKTTAQRRGMLFLLLGIEMSLVISTLLFSAAGMAIEQDRYRYGTLQALGVSAGQFFGGELWRSLGISAAACLAANLIFAFLQLLVAAWGGGFWQTLMENLHQYPWLVHASICAAFIVIFSLIQTLPVLQINRQQPIQNIRS